MLVRFNSAEVFGSVPVWANRVKEVKLDQATHISDWLGWGLWDLLTIETAQSRKSLC